MVSDDRGSASLAAGILHASSEIDAFVVEGGMTAWMAGGFPIWQERLSLPLPDLLSAIAVLLALAGIAFALAKILITAFILILIGTAAALFKAGLPAESPARKTRIFAMSKSDRVQWCGISGAKPAHAR